MQRSNAILSPSMYLSPRYFIIALIFLYKNCTDISFIYLFSVCWNISNYFILKFLSNDYIAASIASILRKSQYRFSMNNHGGRSWSALWESYRGIIFELYSFRICCPKVKKDLSRVSYTNIAYDRYQLISSASNCHQWSSRISLVKVQRKWFWRIPVVRYVSTYFSILNIK